MRAVICIILHLSTKRAVRSHSQDAEQPHLGGGIREERLSVHAGKVCFGYTRPPTLKVLGCSARTGLWTGKFGPATLVGNSVTSSRLHR